eukprot:GHVT01055107.1.p1 GENE.GHVT01055107.1~~GHVT01055107.1.p1  ORF type:complete len:161 (+),score=27.35 GHVT01055107.1:1000-1482(+)
MNWSFDPQSMEFRSLEDSDRVDLQLLAGEAVRPIQTLGRLRPTAVTVRDTAALIASIKAREVKAHPLPPSVRSPGSPTTEFVGLTPNQHNAATHVAALHAEIANAIKLITSKPQEAGSGKNSVDASQVLQTFPHAKMIDRSNTHTHTDTEETRFSSFTPH